MAVLFVIIALCVALPLRSKGSRGSGDEIYMKKKLTTHCMIVVDVI